MKRRNLFLVAALVLSFFMTNAQNAEEGDKILNFGVGLGNNYYSGSAFSNTFPAVAASFEMIVKDGLFNDGKGALGVGGQLGFVSYKYQYGERSYGGDFTENIQTLKSAMAGTFNSEWKYSRFIVGPRGYLHYSFLDKLDTYTGLMLGLELFSSKGGLSDKPISTRSSTNFVWAWFVGGRYYFNDQFAAMLELGYGITYANIGIAYKFGN